MARISKFFWIKFLFGAVIILFIGAVVGGYIKITPALSVFDPVQTERIDKSTIVLERISSVWELATTKYYYSNVITYKESKKFNNIDIPFTEKSFMIKYDGYIKAGIDAKDIYVISVDQDSIKLRVGKAKILDHVIEEKSVYVYDENDSIFNNLSMKDVFDRLGNEKQKTEESFKEKGMLDTADKSTKIFLESFLKDLGYKNIEIVL